jgi:hypothetical protein
MQLGLQKWENFFKPPAEEPTGVKVNLSQPEFSWEPEKQLQYSTAVQDETQFQEMQGGTPKTENLIFEVKDIQHHPLDETAFLRGVEQAFQAANNAKSQKGR